MQGVSTKLTAATIAAAVTGVLVWVMSASSFGPGWTPPPVEVISSITMLIAFGVGYLVPEKANIS